MPWRNGGGRTTEIAVGPPGADLDTFDWRISWAEVAADGPFSLFSGVERTLVLWTGAGLRLRPPDGPSLAILPGGAPARFAADVEHTATLIDGAITDLNVMTRRARASHEVCVTTAPTQDVVTRSGLCFLVCLRGVIDCRAENTAAQSLETGDALRIEDRPGLPMTLSLLPDARVAIIEIWMREA